MSAGVKESKELVEGVMILSALLLRELKDGFQVADLPVILSKIGSDERLKEAVKGLSEVPAEFKDLTPEEIVQLVVAVVVKVPELLAALK